MLRWQLPLADKVLRSDEDSPVPVPPGEDLPSPVKEPPDQPVLEPDHPVREPGPDEPRRLRTSRKHRKGGPKAALVNC